MSDLCVWRVDVDVRYHTAPCKEITIKGTEI